MPKKDVSVVSPSSTVAETPELEEKDVEALETQVMERVDNFFAMMLCDVFARLMQMLLPLMKSRTFGPLVFAVERQVECYLPRCLPLATSV